MFGKFPKGRGLRDSSSLEKASALSKTEKRSVDAPVIGKRELEGLRIGSIQAGVDRTR